MKQPHIVLYGIPNCDTVKKARAWLAEQGLEYRFHDFKKEGVPESQLALWFKDAGLDKVLNRKGTTWRGLTPTEQQNAAQADYAMALILKNPSLIKRPVAEWHGGTVTQVTVGFDPEHWALNAQAR
jgi:Spx/MgsR family transcriptional regulator